MDMEWGTLVGETDNLNKGDKDQEGQESGQNSGECDGAGGERSTNVNNTSDEAMSQEPSSSGQGAGGGGGGIKDVVLKMLDEMDGRIEKLRSGAMSLENEKDDILSSLDAFGNAELVFKLEGIERDEINRYLDRLARRCVAVQVGISAERSSPQLESLNKVNNMIDTLIRDSKEDTIKARRRCVSYINACSEQVVDGIPDIDAKFETCILGCSVEDQKRIKKRLTGLHSYFKSSAQTFAIMEEEEDEAIAVERSLQKS